MNRKLLCPFCLSERDTLNWFMSQRKWHCISCQTVFTVDDALIRCHQRMRAIGLLGIIESAFNETQDMLVTELKEIDPND